MSKSSRQKLLNLLLILTSFLGYLEWGGGNSIFLIEGEIDVVKKLFTDPAAAAHPFTILPLLGQLLLAVTLFQKQPNCLLTLVGLICLGLLLGFMFLIGAVSPQFQILASTIPFLIVAVLVILELRKK